MNRKITYGKFNSEGEFIVYIITREYRINYNWALFEAAKTAQENNKKLVVLALFDKERELLNDIQAPFLLDGIKELNAELSKSNISLLVIEKLCIEELNSIIPLIKINQIFTDLFPLKKVDHFVEQLKKKVPVSIVDSHNIVPVFAASDKEEFGAYTIRPKIKKVIKDYLVDFPSLPLFSKANMVGELDTALPEIKSKSKLKGGYSEAKKLLEEFIKNKFADYSELRNDPTKHYTSNLSPYLHFGFISSLEIYQTIAHFDGVAESKQSFLEELVVRKELADNFCFYNKKYDSLNGIKSWALKTLNDHRNDKREFDYTLEEFLNCITHDPLWNAAQSQLIKSGKIHGYMRMYWAKKILEWSKTPELAFDIAIYLNDKYALDGIDPNGYTGIAWSIGGIHDRAWKERKVFGKIRYMNYNGCKRKFDVKKYILENEVKNETNNFNSGNNLFNQL